MINKNLTYICTANIYIYVCTYVYIYLFVCITKFILLLTYILDEQCKKKKVKRVPGLEANMGAYTLYLFMNLLYNNYTRTTTYSQ